MSVLCYEHSSWVNSRRCSYYTMLRNARWSHSTSSVCPSPITICVSVTFRYVFHRRWNTSKIISRPNSLRCLIKLTPPWAIWFNRNTPKIGLKRVGIVNKKNCTISETVQDIPRLPWQTNMKSHTRFWLVSKSMTLDDLERPKRQSCRNKKVLRSPPEKYEWR